MKIKLLTAILLSVGIGLGAQSPLEDSIQLFQRQLDSIQNKLDKISAHLGELAQRETVTLTQLDALQKKIAVTQELLKRLTAQIELRNREISEITTQLLEINKQIQQRQELLKKRVFAIYKYSRVFPLQALLTSKNIPELYRRALNLRLISRQDKKLIFEMATLIKQAEQKRQSLLVARSDIERLQRETQEKQVALESARNEETVILKRIRQEKETNKRIEQELKTSRDKLQQLITDLLSRRARISGNENYIEQNKGKLIWPVSGTVIARFGSQTHPRYRTKTNNPGIDIKVRPGASVQVVAPGKVVYADRFIGYGNLIIVDHGVGYYTLYGNLTTISTIVNAELSTGTSIGTVDDYLHFEIRKEGQPVNPLEYLAPE
ncbi:MAG: peptidoglycan DD-metalloendopeptidase family protein [candidate division WOR-3 bacterium]|jgi:septal ring factor EnvC (AmiA/AmiB activator)|nr:peptidoglycan DD-metalloendopeptidase family protein [candidate division WOR-3 bacterium]MCR4423156.1 peptidoglycan DD-metalloendopeptidase family protein [candidate division WOR-3 bacterium]MDH7518495.1 peptidoglycan DD-metalloendopeptidase family protein [bacterium]